MKEDWNQNLSLLMLSFITEKLAGISLRRLRYSKIAFDRSMINATSLGVSSYIRSKGYFIDKQI